MNYTEVEEKALKKAESDIQDILIAVSNKLGRDIDQVQIDTRMFGNLRVEIFLA